VISAFDVQGPNEHFGLVVLNAPHNLLESVNITCQCGTVRAVFAADDDAGAKIRCDLIATKTDSSHSPSVNLSKTQSCQSTIVSNKNGFFCCENAACVCSGDFSRRMTDNTCRLDVPFR